MINSTLARSALTGLLALLLSAGADARNIAVPDYAADWSMETADGKQAGTVYVSGGMERREVDEGGEKLITIFRPDKKVVWTLMLADKIYLESALGKDKSRKGDVSDYDIEQSPAGEETVNGIRATKSKVVMKEKKPNGAKLGGFMWTSREGVVVKMDVLSIDKGSKERIKSELKNLKLGKQDPALFEIPPGFEKMSGVAALGQMFKGGKEDEEGSDDEKAAPKPKGKASFGLKDALEMFK